MTSLFKFVSNQEAVLSIAGGSLKFSKPVELNDPSELLPLMDKDAILRSLAALRVKGYTEHQFIWLGCQHAVLGLLSPETMAIGRPSTIELANQTLTMPFYDDYLSVEKQFLRTIGLIRSRVGVLSLTERFDSLPMWAHYGAQAKGYVMRFDGLDKKFSGDATGSLNVLKRVQYVEDMTGMTFDPPTQDNLFFCKFKDWSYEREWRVVSALSNCQLSTDGKMNLRLVELPIVTGVICGWNVPNKERSFLAEQLLKINPCVQLHVASLDRGRVTFNAMPHA
jgi:hypothetical protein